MSEENILQFDDVVSEKSSNIEQKPIKHKLEVNNCPIERVTIFRFGSAIIVRKVEVKFEKEGEQKVVINYLKDSTVGNSVRVSGVGEATIQDVSYKKNAELPKEKKEELAKKIEEELTVLNKEKEEVESKLEEIGDKKERKMNEITRVEKQLQFLSQYSNSVLNVSKDDKQLNKMLQTDTFTAIADYMQYEVKFKEDIQEKLNNLMKQVEELKKDEKKINQDLNHVKKRIQDVKDRKEKNNQVSITVDILKPGTIAQFYLQYMVNNAEWYPCFDARVETDIRTSSSNQSSQSSNAKGKKKKDGDLKLTYYGVLKQSTGEDWIDCNISLSTAAANITTEPPELPQLNAYIQYGATFKSKSISSRRVSLKKKNFGGFNPYTLQDEMNEEIDQDDEEDDEDDEDEGSGHFDMEELPEMSVQKATTEKGGTSSLFHIPRAASVPSDSQSHKVTIAEITMPASFSYHVVPKVDTKTYLKVKTTNDSDYQLLPGDMNIFVDGNFISNGKMKQTYPNEEFKNFLGVDPAIKVEYKAPQYFKETLGILSGKQNKITVSRRISLKNTKSSTSNIIVCDQIPKSTDEKIKVQLLFPVEIKDLRDVKAKKEFHDVRISENDSFKAEKLKVRDNGIVEWQIQMQPSEEKEIEFKYCVTWPQGVYLDDSSL